MAKVPYAEALGGLDPQVVIAETPQRLAAVLDGLSAEAAEVAPAPGKWCLREVMAHLADCEIVWSWRLRQVYGEDHARVQPFEQDAWARAYGSYSLAEARACFMALRAWNLAFVGGLSEADKRKVLTHPEWGERTLWTIVAVMAGHDLHHLAKLEA